MRDNNEPTYTTNTILMILCVCVAVILFLLCSCKTTHEVERVYTHDTLYVNNSDTVREVKVTHHTDTVRQIETHTYTINNVGDTIREIHHYHDVQHTIVVDSTERYEAKVDSLQVIISQMREKQATIVKKPSFWEHLKDYAIGGVVMLIALAIVWWKRKK